MAGVDVGGLAGDAGGTLCAKAALVHAVLSSMALSNVMLSKLGTLPPTKRVRRDRTANVYAIEGITFPFAQLMSVFMLVGSKRCCSALTNCASTRLSTMMVRKLATKLSVAARPTPLAPPEQWKPL